MRQFQTDPMFRQMVVILVIEMILFLPLSSVQAVNPQDDILIEEQLQLQSEAVNRLLERYQKRKISLKIKFISYKLYYLITMKGDTRWKRKSTK